MVDFNTYLEKTEISTAKASKELGLSYETIRSYRCGLRRPDLEGINIIRNWSHNEVSYEDWLKNTTILQQTGE